MKITDETFDNMNKLADKIIAKYTEKNSLIIPMVGAGASIVAGIPSGESLKNIIYNRLVEGCSEFQNPICDLLDQEAIDLFGEKGSEGIKKLSLFEFASIVSKFAYGRKTIHEVVDTEISKPKKVPLAYELLAHLTKHNFIDHFISLNFDELLERSLQDEIPNRLRVVAGADDLPGPNFKEKSKKYCYLLKPFGTFHKDKYKLTPEDVMKFGDNSLWQFCINNIFNYYNGTKFPDVTLLLVGYSASEVAFEELCLKLNTNHRKVDIYVIKKNEKLGHRFEALQNTLKIKINPIVLDADVALDILATLIQIKLKEKQPHAPLVSHSRHQIISNCMSYNNVVKDDNRFEVEVILQAIKSRGFFTIESVGAIQRIRNYASNANQVIKKMVNFEILMHNIPFEQFDDPKSCDDENRWSQDYNLNMGNESDFAEKLLDKWGKNPEKIIKEFDVCLEKKEVLVCDTTLKQYLADRIVKIGAGVEIEINGKNNDPSARWLFSRPKEITTISDLGNISANMLEKMLSDTNHFLHIFGIWSTGEWLFHEKGYAYCAFGKEIIKRLKQGNASLHMINCHPDSDILKSIKKDRSNEVIAELNKIKNETVDIGLLSWWRLNRRMTLLRIENEEQDEQQEGIYFC